MAYERRKYVRRRVSLPVTIRIIVEEETFTPFLFEAQCIDLSAGGALLRIPEITVEQYMLLFRRTRYVRMRCRFPLDADEVSLFGRVVWHELIHETKPCSCKAAVMFEPLSARDLRRVDDFLNPLAEAGSTRTA